MNNALTLGTSAIREVDGLFSLNDLHAAAGGESKHRPSEWLRNVQTQALIAAIQQSPDSGFSKAGIPALLKKHGGRNGSQTYACKELVIAYAAWISAAFHLKVIRVFLGTQPSASPAPAPQRQQPLRIEHDTKGITPYMASAINARAMVILSSALPSIHAWLTEQVKQGCIAPGGGQAPNFEATLVSCDFAAFSTNWATHRLDSAIRLAEFAHAETARALANVATERNRINKGQS